MTGDTAATTGRKTADQVEIDTEAEAQNQRRVTAGAKLGTKSAGDVARQNQDAGPLIRYGVRPPVRVGAKVGVRGENEGLVTFAEADDARALKLERLAAQGAGPFAPGQRHTASREPDYLGDERSGPQAPADDPNPPNANPAYGAQDPGTGGTLPASDPKAPSSAPTVDQPTDDDKSKDDLLAEAKDLGLTGYSKLTKDELTAAIAEHQAGNTPTS